MFVKLIDAESDKIIYINVFHIVSIEVCEDRVVIVTTTKQYTTYASLQSVFESITEALEAL